MIKGYEEKFVKDLTPRDIKIAVSGMVIGKWEKGIMVDDGTGCINVEMEGEFKEGSFLRIFGYLVIAGDGFELKGNVVQDLSSVDREIYDKVKKLMNRR